MEPETYNIEVLHFLNPHLIWVEASNPKSENAESCFEQIGVFGVLPLEMMMDPIEDTLKVKRSTEWMPAASRLMKKLFEEAVEISFCPLHLDHRSTVFDDNIHKYGEIIIKQQNGKYRLLSKLLAKSGVATYNESLFLSELSSGNIKTKLSSKTTKNIIEQLEKKCKEQAVKQTKVSQTSLNLESALTVENLTAHNQRTKNKTENFEEMLQMKLYDLQLCKEVDEEAIGRATKKKERGSDTSSMLLKRKMKLLKCEQNTLPGAANVFVKQHMADLNALQKPAVDTEPHQKDDEDEERPFTAETSLHSDGYDGHADNNSVQKRKFSALLKLTKAKIHTDYNAQKKSEDIDEAHNDLKTAVKTSEKPSESDYIEEVVVPRKQKKRPIDKKTRTPEYDVTKEHRVAYGPPDANISVLPSKVISRQELLKKYEIEESKDEEMSISGQNEKEDPFGEEDSYVEFKDYKSPEKTANRFLKQNLSKKQNSSTTSDTSNKDSSTSVEDDRFNNHEKDVSKNICSQNIDSDDDSMAEVFAKINAEYKPFVNSSKEEEVVDQKPIVTNTKNYVNPFKNVDTNISKFVDKLATPVLMVHSKMSKRFQPITKLRDVPFNTHIQIVLKNMGFEHPMMLQTISWSSILRGYSTFMISPKSSGKTMGYLPAVCRLVADKDSGLGGVGPMSIIVCATSNSVSEVEMFAKMFFAHKERVLAIYSGMKEKHIVTSLLNGCELLICTPSILVRLLQLDFGVDLRRLTSFVLDDCERLAEEFSTEIKFFLFKIKEMLKSRVHKEVKVQYILASRVWCDFMETLARKAPDTVVSIGAFQECVLYSKANTTASFVTKENKIKSVVDFLKSVDTTKRTVIVCRTDEEVEELEKVLKEEKYVVFASNSEMTVQDLYNLRGSWDDYFEPVIGPILLCLDGNLTHLNITDAHHLVHYSLPSLFSAFCKRFSVLNENYPSIFNAQNEAVKIKILLEDCNVEQLPKILHFIKRCTSEVPTSLDEICERILAEKDDVKAKQLVPICDRLLTLGECPEFWHCQDRHAVVKKCDEPEDWMPTEGLITFKILHYHSAVHYSARLIENTTNEQTKKYPEKKISVLAVKISMYFGRESNRRLHGAPKVGDVCAISVKQNFFVRCQVVKILSYYENGKPNSVLVNLIDEEKVEKTKDVYLYHLPEEFKKVQTHVVHVRIANLQPKDKDITFSDLAKSELQKITDDEEDLYMRGRIALTIGNCVILESVEVCRDLSTLGQTVVLHDFKKILLEKHAMVNEENLKKLKKLCLESGMEVTIENAHKAAEAIKPAKKLPKPQWAHLEKDDLSAVLFSSAEDPSTFFVRLVKFEVPCKHLVQDIQKYAAENKEELLSVSEGDIVLAKLPDDDMFERARIDEIINEDKVKCFFVDYGDWREVNKRNLIPISEKLITQLPFQAIECRLVGVRPPGENWTEFVTTWFSNCFEDDNGDLKQIFAKYFTKEKAQYTGGHKYGVVLVDTHSDPDVIINNLIMELNLAQEEESEIKYLDELEFKNESVEIPKELSDMEDVDDSWEKVSNATKSSSSKDDFVRPNMSLNEIFPKQPIRSVPLVGSDESDISEDRWQFNMSEDFMAMFKPVAKENPTNFPAIKNADSKSASEVSACKNYSAVDESSDSDSSVQKLSSQSDIHVVPSANIPEIDSDDYTSPESSMIRTTSEKNLIKEVATSRHVQAATPIANLLAPETKLNDPDPLRKPKVLWHQKKRDVTVKILLIGVEKYDMVIEERRLKFHAMANDTEYGFDIDLYGIIDKKTATHSNKGQYIRVNLYKVLDRNWLTLTKTSGIKNWITYDVDAIDVESTDDEDDNNDAKDVIKGLCNEEIITDSEDDDSLVDDHFA
ncbi:tudor domain-containing protein [Phthorimaea operculella]|nr:tudor domain-containing protein [Phthorimaea operculella]